MVKEEIVREFKNIVDYCGVWKEVFGEYGTPNTKIEEDNWEFEIESQKTFSWIFREWDIIKYVYIGYKPSEHSDYSWIAYKAIIFNNEIIKVKKHAIAKPQQSVA